jgi:endo-1,4-beta-xylanase
MKNKPLFLGLLALASCGLFIACKKQDINILNTGNFKNTDGTLQAASDFPIGFGADYQPMKGNADYLNTMKTEGSSVTFAYEMKHGAIVKDDGSYDYSNADDQLNIATSAGLQVYGHTLVWHQNQNATYLNGLVGGGGNSGGEQNLISNGDFETWGSTAAGGWLSGTAATGWAVYNFSGIGSFSQGSGANAHGGSYSLAANVTDAANQSNYKLQIASPSFSVTAGQTYTVKFWIKASVAGCNWQGEGRSPSPSTTVSYTGNQSTPTSWSPETFTFTPDATGSTVITFDLASSPLSTTYIDDLTITEGAPVVPPTGQELQDVVDSAMGQFIRNTMTHFAGKVKAWDVVNEPLADNGSLRTSHNTTIPSGATDFFFWSDYLGRSYALKAFQYAHAADPDALLFINDYALESNAPKLDSLIAFVNELKSEGAQVDGIGTQMHINLNTSLSGIDAAFQKLAATGLKIRVSELDIRINPTDKSGFSALPPDPVQLGAQAALYQYVVSSYIKNVPAGQRYGITVWGVDDPESWIVVTQKKSDYPLLFDGNFAKKPAYAGFLQGLKGQ